MNNADNNGCILGCQNNSAQCHYRCCEQSRITSNDFCQENAILLYPGEWTEESEETKKHILISDNNHHGGKLGYCDKENFDQSHCDPSQNFKPLDCQSYPFFPVIIEGKLRLAIDTIRCPLSNDVEVLKEHYQLIFSKWMKVIEDNENVKTWIESISLNGYDVIDIF